MKHYDALRSVPKDALKPIEFGNLKGKSDINPQWRYEAMTKEFGPCGIGWKFEVVNTWTQPANDGQVMVFVEVRAYIKEGNEWSAPVPAIGGDFLIKKDKNGLHGNDEAYKMATTDALGTALKMFGVAADIYRGVTDTKYSRQQQDYPATNKPSNNNHTTFKQNASQGQQNVDKATDSQISAIEKLAKVKGTDISKYNLASIGKFEASKLIKELQSA